MGIPMATNILVSQGQHDVLHSFLSNSEQCCSIGNHLCLIIIVAFHTDGSPWISVRQIGSIHVVIFDMIQSTVSVAKLFSSMRNSVTALWQNEISLTEILFQ
jgi:hypothetical protein